MTAINDYIEGAEKFLDLLDEKDKIAYALSLALKKYLKLNDMKPFAEDNGFLSESKLSLIPVGVYYDGKDFHFLYPTDDLMGDLEKAILDANKEVEKNNESMKSILERSEHLRSEVRQFAYKVIDDYSKEDISRLVKEGEELVKFLSSNPSEFGIPSGMSFNFRREVMTHDSIHYDGTYYFGDVKAIGRKISIIKDLLNNYDILRKEHYDKKMKSFMSGRDEISVRILANIGKEFLDYLKEIDKKYKSSRLPKFHEIDRGSNFRYFINEMMQGNELNRFIEKSYVLSSLRRPDGKPVVTTNPLIHLASNVLALGMPLIMYFFHDSNTIQYSLFSGVGAIIGKSYLRDKYEVDPFGRYIKMVERKLDFLNYVVKTFDGRN